MKMVLLILIQPLGPMVHIRRHLATQLLRKNWLIMTEWKLFWSLFRDKGVPSLRLTTIPQAGKKVLVLAKVRVDSRVRQWMTKIKTSHSLSQEPTRSAPWSISLVTSPCKTKTWPQTTWLILTWSLFPIKAHLGLQTSYKTIKSFSTWLFMKWNTQRRPCRVGLTTFRHRWRILSISKCPCLAQTSFLRTQAMSAMLEAKKLTQLGLSNKLRFRQP